MFDNAEGDKRHEIHTRLMDIDATYRNDLNLMRREHRAAEDTLLREIDARVQAGGVDPDVEARQKRRERKERVILLRAARAAPRAAPHAGAGRVEEELDVHWGPVGIVAGFYAGEQAAALGEGIPHAPRALAVIAGDKQSIHTVEVVSHMRSIVDKVRKVEVPLEYQWNTRVVSKTPGEIIAGCKLSGPATVEMIRLYTLDTAIYDIEQGIYGKVMDSMWQFVKNHPETESLRVIIKEEIEAGVGYCAQGNLTRICNVLAGYIEDITPPSSRFEQANDRIQQLLSVEDVNSRKMSAKAILLELGFKEGDAHWSAYMETVA